eukprot:gene9727-6415_t
MRRFRVAWEAAPPACGSSSVAGVSVLQQTTVVEVTSTTWLDLARALRQHAGRNLVRM